MPEHPHAPRTLRWVAVLVLVALICVLVPQLLVGWSHLRACDAAATAVEERLASARRRALELERQLEVLEASAERAPVLPAVVLPDASREEPQRQPQETPQEVPHPHSHVYRVFNDVCVRRTPLDPRLFEQDRVDNAELSKSYDRVLSLCRSAKGEDVEWPLPPTGPAPERTHHPKNLVLSSRFKVQAGGAECGPRSRWLRQAIYLHAGHKITARWPLNSRSLNMAHWMSDSIAPLLVAAATLNESFARAPEVVILDAENTMPPNAIHAAVVLADLFAEAWNRSVPLVRAVSFPGTTCMRQLVLPDNVVELRLSEKLPATTDDGTGKTQAWYPSYGQPGPTFALAKLAVDSFRRKALSSCNISVKERSCMGSVAVFGREGDNKRRLRNTDALVLGLMSEGLDVQAGFEFAKMSWCETLRTMSSVDLFVSMHGANVGFNIFFMQPSAIVLELFPNSSHASLLSTVEQKNYRKGKGHWSMSCPWDYFASLNFYQALSLYYKCLGARLPPGTEEDQLYPANYPCDVCVPCILDWVRKVEGIRKKRGGLACR